MSSTALVAARKAGEIAAGREALRLNIDQTRPVDIFRIIERAQLWLIFKPFESALGTYFPGGILVNSQRTLPIQRLTAAHEYGHHVLNHTMSVDGETNLGSPTQIGESNEAAAQSFATDFLMPVKLVNTLWKKLNLPTRIEPRHAYALSLHMGTSYQATVYQLIAQERIKPARAEEFKVQPKKIKSSITGGIGPRNSRADVWLLEQNQSGESIQVSLDDEIRLALRESPSTGYI